MRTSDTDTPHCAAERGALGISMRIAGKPTPSASHPRLLLHPFIPRFVPAAHWRAAHAPAVRLAAMRRAPAWCGPQRRRAAHSDTPPRPWRRSALIRWPIRPRRAPRCRPRRGGAVLPFRPAAGRCSRRTKTGRGPSRSPGLDNIYSWSTSGTAPDGRACADFLAKVNLDWTIRLHRGGAEKCGPARVNWVQRNPIRNGYGKIHVGRISSSMSPRLRGGCFNRHLRGAPLRREASTEPRGAQSIVLAARQRKGDSSCPT